MVSSILKISMGNFRELRVWQLGKDLAVKIYTLTNRGDFKNDYRLRDQIRAAAVSVPSNIAEGDELDTIKQSLRHFHIARGSLAELLTQAIIANEIGYLNKADFKIVEQASNDLSMKIKNLITARSKFI